MTNHPKASGRAGASPSKCWVKECDNLAYKDGLCASCHATAATVRADFERYKRTGITPTYVRGPAPGAAEGEADGY